MTTPQDGGPAFPCVGQYVHNSGMSLRDYFAGQAMTALFLAQIWPCSKVMGYDAPLDSEQTRDFAKDVADKAWFIADAMLEQRDKHKETQETRDYGKSENT